jgi:hypothetical protein
MPKHVIFSQLLPRGGKNYNTHAAEFNIMVVLIMIMSWPAEIL